MSCYCDYDPSDVWCEAIVKARKPRRCIECSGTIKPGETYHRVKSLYDGRWSTLVRCCDCKAIACEMNTLAGSDGCFCNMWGGLMEEMCDFADEMNGADLPQIEPIFAAFNVASKHRGGRQLGMCRFEKEDKQ